MDHGKRAELALAIRLLRDADFQDGRLDIEVHAMARRLEDIQAELGADGPPVVDGISATEDITAFDAYGSEDGIVFVD